MKKLGFGLMRMPTIDKANAADVDIEQVGSIGEALPRDDVQTVTQSGDIVLYSGNQLVVFYGSNSWAYTRLGHIVDQSEEDMARLLSNGNVVITISVE